MGESKSDWDRQVYGITYVWNLKKKKWYKWTYLQNRNRLTDIENKFIITKGDGREELGVWDQQTHIAIHKADKQQGACNNL